MTSDLTTTKWPFEIDSNGSLASVSDTNVIIQSVYNILDTPKGSIWNMPEFGCNIHILYWEPIKELFVFLSKLYIKDAIERWEPRVVFKGIDIIGDVNAVATFLIHVRVKNVDKEISFDYQVKRMS